MGNPQKWHVRFFVARTFDVTVESHSLEDAWNRAQIKFSKRRGKGFRKGRDLIVLRSWADPADQAAIKAYGEAGFNIVGNFEQPVFVVSESPPKDDRQGWLRRPIEQGGGGHGD